MKKTELNESVKYIISRLEAAGHRADIVGGCVRDFLLGKAPHDFDITTSATPDEMREIFAAERTLEVGLKHGTLTIIHGGEPYEITTYRTEGDYRDHRHPSAVSFSRTLTDDLSRRDFTSNAICYSDTHGITDPFGGVDDIKKKLLRAVGDPNERFEEDALRIMRALRFAATLGFSIEEKTAAALRKKAHLLEFISAERILSEYKRLIEGEWAHEIVSSFPEIIAWVLRLEAPLSLLPRARFLSLEPSLRTLSIFALSTDKPSAAFSRAAAALRLDNDAKREGERILDSLDLPLSDGISIRLALMKLGEKDTRSLVRLLIACDSIGQSVETCLDEIISSRAPYRISDLAISGDDLLREGLCGREVGKALTDALMGVIYGRVENTREALLKYLNLHA